MVNSQYGSFGNGSHDCIAAGGSLHCEDIETYLHQAGHQKRGSRE